MSKRIQTLLLATSFIFAAILTAQGMDEVGLHLGVHGAGIWGGSVRASSTRTGMKAGFTLGGYSTSMRDERFGVQRGLYISLKGGESDYHYESSTMIQRYHVNNSLIYLEVPLLGVWVYSDKLSLLAGAYIDYFLLGVSDIQGTTDVPGEPIQKVDEIQELAPGDLKKLGYGLIAGVSCSLGKMNLVFRCSLGLNNVMIRDRYFLFGEYDWSRRYSRVDVRNYALQFLLEYPIRKGSSGTS